MQHQIGNYLYHHPDYLKKVHGRYIVLIASAYNAFGLIGPEHNGIVVLDDKDRCVVLDRHVEQLSGYNGPSKRQVDEFNRVTELPENDFVQFCHANPRCR